MRACGWIFVVAMGCLGWILGTAAASRGLSQQLSPQPGAYDTPGSTPVQYYDYAYELLKNYGADAVPAVSRAMANSEISNGEYDMLYRAGTDLKRAAARKRVLKSLGELTQPEQP